MFITILISTFVLIVLYHLLKRIKFANSLPPGPRAWPIVGNLLQIDQNDPRNTFMEWHKKYGPIFTVWLATKPTVIITGFDLMQELFVKRGEEFTDRPYSFLFEHFTKGKFGIANAVGEQWKEQRRFSLHTLRNFGVGRKIMEEKIESEIQKLIQSLNEQLGDSETKNLNIKIDVSVCVSNIISSIVLGRTYSPNDPHFGRLKSGMDEVFRLFASARFQMLNCFPWLRHIPILHHFGFDDTTIYTDDFLGIISEDLEQHKKQLGENCEAHDFAAAYLQEMKRRKTAGESLGYFNEWQLICIIGDIWNAGMETTVTTLLWGILLMMHHRDVQEKVKEEIKRVAGYERFLTMADRPQMPYTSAVIQEVQRYANIFPFNLPRTVNEDTNVAGYTIPKGITIVPQISVVLYDDKIYDEPRQFNPGHFIESDEKTLKNTDQLIPFSLGKRICMGEGLARMELFLIFTSLLQRFTFSFVEDEPKPSLNPNMGITMSPKPYNVCISRQS